MAVYAKAIGSVLEKDAKQFFCFAIGEQTYQFEFAPWVPRVPGEYKVSVADDGSRLFGAFPTEGVFNVKFENFLAKKDQPPMVGTKIRTAKNGGYWADIYAMAKLKIVGPADYAGLAGTVGIPVAPKDFEDSRRGALTTRALMISALGHDWKTRNLPIPQGCGSWKKDESEQQTRAREKYISEVLEKLQKVLLEEQPAAGFMVSMKNGWLDSFFYDPRVMTKVSEKQSPDQDELEWDF